MKCELHTDLDAVGTCCNCGRFVCPECKVIIEGQLHCNRCLEERLKTGAWPGQSVPVSSCSPGMGAHTPVPAEIKGWSWGGFLLTWIWGIGNNVWIALISVLGFIPWIGWLISLTMRIILGIKGNEWAWQHKKWESVEHFRKVQRTWMWAGVGIIVLQFILFIAILTLIVSLFMIGITIDKDWNWKNIIPWQ